MIKLIDNISGHTVEVEKFDVAETLAGWFTDAPDEVTDAIRDLEAKVLRGEYVGDIAAYLEITVA